VYNVRLTVPVGATGYPFTISGTSRSYSCVSGETIDVNDADALILASNGWVRLAEPAAAVGPTTSRPAHAPINRQFIDTTIEALIVSDGAENWLNAVTGAIS
jgi:hypothetical protein